MTPVEHLKEAEELLQYAKDWGPSSNSSANAALIAMAHIQLAQAKESRQPDFPRVGPGWKP